MPRWRELEAVSPEALSRQKVEFVASLSTTGSRGAERLFLMAQLLESSFPGLGAVSEGLIDAGRRRLQVRRD
eukprot:scaffold1672_cov234-Pinguiococcus_pyrenoidosus.AAC.3